MMINPNIFKLIFVFNFFIISLYGQEIVKNTCDSTLLTKQEYEKCLVDSAWTSDIIHKTNYIIKLKTDILPKYRLLRKELIIPTSLQQSLRQLKLIYDTVLYNKLFFYQKDMDSNQKYIQPKAYLSSMLSFQVFKFYPDIYAILLNDLHLQLSPKTTIEQLELYKKLFEKTINLTPEVLFQKILKITYEFNIDNNKISNNGFSNIFHGLINDDYKNQCDVINFLIWSE